MLRAIAYFFLAMVCYLVPWLGARWVRRTALASALTPLTFVALSAFILSLVLTGDWTSSDPVTLLRFVRSATTEEPHLWASLVRALPIVAVVLVAARVTAWLFGRRDPESERWIAYAMGAQIALHALAIVVPVIVAGALDDAAQSKVLDRIFEWVPLGLLVTALAGTLNLVSTLLWSRPSAGRVAAAVAWSLAMGGGLAVATVIGSLYVQDAARRAMATRTDGYPLRILSATLSCSAADSYATLRMSVWVDNHARDPMHLYLTENSLAVYVRPPNLLRDPADAGHPPDDWQCEGQNCWDARIVANSTGAPLMHVATDADGWITIEMPIDRPRIERFRRSAPAGYYDSFDVGVRGSARETFEPSGPESTSARELQSDWYPVQIREALCPASSDAGAVAIDAGAAPWLDASRD